MSDTLPARRLLLQRLAALLVLPLLLAACATPVEQRNFPDIHYTSQPPIRLNVATIDVTQSYIASNAAPHVDQLFPEQPAKAAAQWARDRLQAVGQGGSLTYDVVDAAAIDTKLPRSTGLSALTSIDQTDQFDLTIAVKVSAVSGDNLHRGTAQATVTRSQTISEKTTPAERDGVWYDMTQQAMDEINAKLESQIDQNLAWFKQTPN
jgi:hypothetical protein